MRKNTWQRPRHLVFRIVLHLQDKDKLHEMVKENANWKNCNAREGIF